MSSFYTRKGDDGYTGLLGEGRVPKYHIQIEAVGAVDEASAALGMARAACKVPLAGELILHIQRDLYHIMAEAAATPENAARFRVIGENQVGWLEQQTNSVSQHTQVPNEFILPGDTPAGAALDLARTVIRRAERRMVELSHARLMENQQVLRYLNRLSSLCFVLELLENQAAGKDSPTFAKETE